ncbi:MAG: class I SAM-dependent methyltransferase [Burkholderiales bacterium]|nr:class I SAM-dependent methyltransferase [Burkholderiales bacterium]
MGIDELQREGGACFWCGSVVRFRSLMAILSALLYNEIIPLPDFKRNKKITGMGMSDASCYASPLSAAFSYENTYYHQEPFFDITKIEESDHDKFDFVISSDVFEHVLSPIQPAFDNLCKIIKPGGSLIFSVPYKMAGETEEHFPVLNEFSVQKESSGEWALLNKNANGETERYSNLVFHGGSGATLEMRLFSLEALMKNLREAGFTDIRVHNEPAFKYGIYWPKPFGIPLLARKG